MNGSIFSLHWCPRRPFLFDAHCHLQLRPALADAVPRARTGGLVGAAVCGCDVSDWDKVQLLSRPWRAGLMSMKKGWGLTNPFGKVNDDRWGWPVTGDFLDLTKRTSYCMAVEGSGGFVVGNLWENEAKMDVDDQGGWEKRRAISGGFHGRNLLEKWMSNVFDDWGSAMTLKDSKGLQLL